MAGAIQPSAQPSPLMAGNAPSLTGLTRESEPSLAGMTREPPEDGIGWDDPAEGFRAEEASMALQHRISTQTLPIRLYLDATVVPLLVQALLALGKERPDNPVEWFAAYLLQNDPAHAEERAQ
ncbi:hypothetical protein KFE25_009707 [Diacronema lutheri]|uniref:Uncharacterized protein n=2 Tax=Diacronema lutheri TaxID=2081491 RepID=A0A8J5XYB3_DIALT|nr:hypothetical protein KFE25_009707 [Diacronema lutheri]